ncbi:hypothetical protein [Umezawaea sp. Da 62-37]|uniref:hypothetical protein n=1 Tax=Umezawaea sp. Da 62-37 TaxID=3075927 RepID=UPI0028F727C0|nr:hypothetical protein [Umezawaea sp. Da 62-37]WNV82204.1 hypothetical protein RM788_28800 [Umezawaea sp. Da 62-37]
MYEAHPAAVLALPLALLLSPVLLLAGLGIRALLARLHRPTTTEELRMSEPRPRPLRTAASWIGGVLALVSGLVGAGVLTDTQGSATAAVINAVLVLLGTFGVVIATERKVTPVADPRDNDGTPLVPAPEPTPFGSSRR